MQNNRAYILSFTIKLNRCKGGSKDQENTPLPSLLPPPLHRFTPATQANISNAYFFCNLEASGGLSYMTFPVFPRKQRSFRWWLGSLTWFWWGNFSCKVRWSGFGDDSSFCCYEFPNLLRIAWDRKYKRLFRNQNMCWMHRPTRMRYRLIDSFGRWIVAVFSRSKLEAI